MAERFHGREAPHVAIVIPCLNEQETVGTVVEEFRQAMPEAEVIVIDNASTDATAERAAAAGARVIHESRRGKGNAVRGIARWIDADVYVLVDGDCTYPASALGELLQPIFAGRADMVVGDRRSNRSYASENKRPLHEAGNALVTDLINRVYGSGLHDAMSGYRALTREFIRHLPVIAEGFEVEVEMTLHALDRRYRIAEVPVEYRDRPTGSSSKLRTYADGMLVLKTIASLVKNYKPLFFFGWSSLVILVLGILVGTPVILEFLAHGYVYKVPSAILASSLVVLSMLCLSCGLILDTIVRHHRELYELSLTAASEVVRARGRS